MHEIKPYWYSSDFSNQEQHALYDMSNTNPIWVEFYIPHFVSNSFDYYITCYPHLISYFYVRKLPNVNLIIAFFV